MTATLILRSLFFQKESPSLEKIIIDQKEYGYSPEKEIQINFNEIEKEIGLKIVKIQLKFTEVEEEHFFEILKGTKIIGYLLPRKGKTLDILFNENYKVKSKIKDIISHDFVDLDQKENRLLFINFSAVYELYINDMEMSGKFMGLGEKSIQISIPTLDEKYYLYKDIEPIDYDVFFTVYKEHKNIANKFFFEVKELLENSNDVKGFINKLSLYNKLIDGYNIKINFPKKILLEKYNLIEYFEFISSCCLFYLLSTMNNSIEEIKSFYKFFMDYKNKLEKSQLENYKKCKIIIDFSQRLEKFKTVEEFKKINYQYIERSELKSNSPLNSALLELEKMINCLDENSPFYYPLVLIDSGIYLLQSRYSLKHIYGYGIISKDILKNHLTNIIPEIIIIFNDKIYFKDDQGNTDKNSGIVALNLSSELLSDLAKNDIRDTIYSKKIHDDLSLRIFIVLFHEIFGHKKGGYSTGDDNLMSPNFFYDKKKKQIMKLEYIYSTNINKNIIKILQDPKMNWDSGSFLEYFLGESNYGYISILIEIMLQNKINLNFIFSANLWNKEIKTLQNYIELKYQVFINNKSLVDKHNFENITDEINYLEKVIKENDFKNSSSFQTDSKIIKNEVTRKRKEIFSSKYSEEIDFSQYDDLSIKEIKDKFKDEQTSYEEKMIYKKLLSYRTQRK